ncbi:hypothetical protein SAMN06265182_1199 [Persephonella hydrogeniphila]|uniref:Uncharacterized protein n=1 Tax=Persephonella hydrogeniphila TaxID=198703 RepID=A0A285NFD7_9AQUI|nr:hypothetical protein [Persephonella hydrogeniphila]SNZ08180.1 hypothetical protein SAMN06265182_1199 [Persephonella hydrogeniphila]
MKICYINFYNLENRYRAGALITDESTKPLEFRVTSDLNINRLQEILYGEALEEVLFKERFSVQLVKSMQEQFDIILTKEKSLLSLRKEVDIPVVHIQKYDHFLPLNRLSHKIINIHDRFEPLYITVDKVDEKNVISISNALQEIYRNFNIMEPFKRIENAIKYIMENEIEAERADICIR